MNKEKLRHILSNRILQIILRLIVGGTFIYASIGKIADPVSFAKAINNYQMLPEFTVNFLGVFIPYLEFITGTFLIIGLFKKGSSLIIIVSLILFTIGLLQAYIRGLSINCGCFSLDPSTKSEILIRIIQDIFLLLFTFIILLYSKTKKIVLNNKESENVKQQRI